MHRLLLLLCFLISAAPAVATAGEMRFEHQFSFGERIQNGGGHTNYPSGVAVDPNSGDVYVMDLLFNRVQKFDKEGRFLTMWPCRQGLGLTVDPRNGNVWVAMWLNHEVRQYDSNGQLLQRLGTGKKGAAPGEFNTPHDVSVDPRNGDLYVMDTNNKRVQVFDEKGTFVREWTSSFHQPFGISVHPKGAFLVVANTANRELIKFDLQGKVLARWKRKGSAPGEFRWPRGVAVDDQGFIYVADTDNERAQKLDSEGNFVRFIQGPNDRANGSFHPRAIDVNTGTAEVYAAAAYANRIDRFDTKGDYVSSFGQHEKEGAYFNTAKGIAIDPATGDIFVSDWMDHRIRRFDKLGNYEATLDGWIEQQTDAAGTPLTPEYAADPATGMWMAKEDQAFPGAMDFDGEGKLWWNRGSMHYDDDPRPQADWLVRRIEPDGTFISGFGHADFPRNARMRGLVVDRESGHVYIANSFGNRVMKFDFEGNLVWSVGFKGRGEGQFDFPTAVALDRSAKVLYVVDANNHRIQKLDLDGRFIEVWGGEGTAPGQFRFAQFSSLDVDEKGYVYVADTLNHRLQVFDREGAFVTQFGEQGFGGVGRYSGLSALRVHEGRLYVVDIAGYEVEVFDIVYP